MGCCGLREDAVGLGSRRELRGCEGSGRVGVRAVMGTLWVWESCRTQGDPAGSGDCEGA